MIHNHLTLRNADEVIGCSLQDPEERVNRSPFSSTQPHLPRTLHISNLVPHQLSHHTRCRAKIRHFSNPPLRMNLYPPCRAVQLPFGKSSARRPFIRMQFPAFRAEFAAPYDSTVGSDGRRNQEGRRFCCEREG